MTYFIVCMIALVGSGLTFFSGFGLGTLLLPAFGLFFPIPVAIALTAIVHFLNNIFKLLLVGRNIDKKVALSFGIPSVIAAFAGAYVLTKLTTLPPIFAYSMGEKEYYIFPVKLIIAVLLVVFSLFEAVPRLKNIQFSKKYLPFGGLLSGFFGGLSGHQGALRAAFLLRAGLTKEAFIATGVLIACFIDVSRLSVYSGRILAAKSDIDYVLVVCATLSAFTGAFFGNRFLKKITIDSLQLIVSIMLLVFAALLGAGII